MKGDWLFTFVLVFVGFVFLMILATIGTAIYIGATTSVEDVASAAGRAVATFNKEAGK